MTILRYANSRGLPCIESVGVSTEGTTTTITFNSHPFANGRFQGGLWVKIAQTLASGTNVVQFNVTGVSNSTIPVYLSTGDQATTQDLSSDGNAVHLCFYDRDNNRLQLIA